MEATGRFAAWLGRTASGGARARRRRSARARRRRRTGPGGSGSARRRRRATATASPRATPRTSRCSPSTASPTTGCRSSGRASSPARASATTTPIEHYRAVLEAARDAGVEPWVCLHHFTLPGLVRRRPAAASSTRRPARYWWPRHVDFCAETFGDLVARLEADERAGRATPSRASSAAASRRAGATPTTSAPSCATIHRANADAARLLRGAGAPVATIHNLSPVYAADASPEARDACRRASTTPSGGRGPSPSCSTRSTCRLLVLQRASAVGGDGAFGPYPADAKVGPMGYAPWSAGLGEVLHRLAEEHPDRPLLIDECGIGTDDDDWRATYLRECLDEVERRDRRRHRRARLLPLDRRSTTTSGSTATTCRSACSTATATPRDSIEVAAARARSASRSRRLQHGSAAAAVGGAGADGVLVEPLAEVQALEDELDGAGHRRRATRRRR